MRTSVPKLPGSCTPSRTSTLLAPSCSVSVDSRLCTHRGSMWMQLYRCSPECPAHSAAQRAFCKNCNVLSATRFLQNQRHHSRLCVGSTHCAGKLHFCDDLEPSWFIDARNLLQDALFHGNRRMALQVGWDVLQLCCNDTCHLYATPFGQAWHQLEFTGTCAPASDPAHSARARRPCPLM